MGAWGVGVGRGVAWGGGWRGGGGGGGSELGIPLAKRCKMLQNPNCSPTTYFMVSGFQDLGF